MAEKEPIKKERKKEKRNTEEPVKQLERYPSKGPVVKRIDQETITINEVPYKLIENYRDAFDPKELESRYSDLLDRYDYIMADISDEKARLKGFYRAGYQKAPAELRISSLDEYRLEYCNFGCAYYLLERADGKKGVYSGGRKNTNKKQPSNRRERKPNRENQSVQKNRKNNKSRGRERFFETKEVKQEKTLPVEGRSKRVETVKDEKGKSRFHIRKKEAGDQSK